MSLYLSRVAAVAALLGYGGSAMPDIYMPRADFPIEPPRRGAGGAFGRAPYVGRHRPAGTKLWRKASQKKLGLRW